MMRLIVLLLRASAVRVLSLRREADADCSGMVDSRPAGKTGTCVIGGRDVVVPAKTALDDEEGPLVVGACAEVEYTSSWVEEIAPENVYVWAIRRLSAQAATPVRDASASVTRRCP